MAWWIVLAACKDQGTPCAGAFCDSGIPTDPTPTPSTTIPEDREGRCELFCASEMEVCPSDTACLESCVDHCPTGPSEQEVWCAQDAAAGGLTCAEFDCWGFCS